MKLSTLLDGVVDFIPSEIAEVEITSVVNDSRKSEKNSLFVTYSGYLGDIHSYISDAYERGCRFFIVSLDKIKEFKLEGGYFFGVANVSNALAQIARNFYGDPTSKIKVIGITGTSGKTTTTFALYKALMWMGKKVGLIGTIEYRINDKVFQATNTTPDILGLYDLINKMKEEGIEYLVMEVSSHSLALGRVESINFDICGFTNFSQDHLDFHLTMENYLEAKLKIFDVLSKSSKQKKVIIVNKDMEVFGKIRIKSLSYSDIEFRTISTIDSSADYYLRVIRLSTSKTLFSINNRNLEIGMCGITNVYNFGFAAAILKELGFSESEFSIPFMHTYVKGRMESVPNNLGISILIDYAHKPDALEKILKTVRQLMKSGGKIITVFGCGGDRDKLKRPIMGKIAGLNSDRVIITSDNPRTENPMEIIQEIEKGIKETFTPYEIIENRKEAIFKAIEIAERNDCVIIAGKGHEDYQIIGKEKIHFSDREVALEKIKNLSKGKNYIAPSALKNLFNALKFSLFCSLSLLKEGKKRLVIENIIQLLRDFYLLKNNQTIHSSVLNFLMSFDNIFSIEDFRLISQIERGIKTKKEFLELGENLNERDLSNLLEKIELILRGTENEIYNCDKKSGENKGA